MDKLRDYQEEAKRIIYGNFNNGVQRQMCVIVTGGGKTTIFASITKDYNEKKKKVLLVVHRIELVDQIRNRLMSYRVYGGVISGSRPREIHKNIQVCSVQSLNEGIAQQFKPDLIVIDECHHAAASTYRNMWTMWPNAKILGVTATPIRTDGTGFEDLFEKMEVVNQIKWYIDRGYLVKPIHYVFGSVDVDHIPIDDNTGDYSEEAIRDLFETDARSQKLLETYKKYGKNRKMIVFTTSIERSKQLTKMYSEAGYPAAHIDGEMKSSDRERAVSRFSEGSIRILVNMDIVSEGFDIPDAQIVTLDRKTASTSLYIQWCGRILRTLRDGSKKYGYIFDHGGNWMEHGWVDDYREWSLAGEDKTKKGKGKKRKQKDILDDPNTMALDPGGNLIPTQDIPLDKDVRLVKVDEHLKRILIFEKFLNFCTKEKKDLLHAAFMYRDYLTNNELHITVVETEYIRKKLVQLGKNVKDNFWVHFREEGEV